MASPEAPVGSRGLHPVGWLLVAIGLTVELVVLPIREPSRIWPEIFPPDVAFSAIQSLLQVVRLLAGAATVVVLAWTFRWRNDQSLPATARTAVDCLVAVLVASQVVGSVAFFIWAGAESFRFFGISELAGMALVFVEARVLWLSPPERRRQGRQVGFLDRVLTVGLVLAAVASVLSFLDITAAGSAIEGADLWLFRGAQTQPFFLGGAFLWFLASPHPQGAPGRTLARGLVIAMVVNVLGLSAWSVARFGSSNLVTQYAVMVILFVQMYLSYWAWEHTENEVVPPLGDGIDWNEVPTEVRSDL